MAKTDTSENKYLKFFPFLQWIGKLKNPKTLKKDIVAGMTVALVLIPQSMAYAGLAGLPLEVGLYTAFIPIMIAALFGSSPQMSTGPVTIISLMTATALAPIAASGTEGYIAYASLLAFFIGVFYLLLGTLKLGVIVDFLSHPVIIGFTNAVAVITITSQLSKIIGASVEKGSNYLASLSNIFDAAINNTHLVTFMFGVFSIFLLLFLARFASKLPRVLILLIVSISISYFIGYNENFGGKIIMDIPNDLPSFSLPIFNEHTNLLSFSQILNLAIFGIIIGLIGFTESISVAKMVGYQTKQRVSANRELIGQGLANLSSSIFGGYGVAGSFSKTAVNLRSGAKTGFSSVISGIFVGITLLYLTPFLYHLPVATLAAIIIVAVFNLIKIEPIIKAWKVEKHDAIVAIVTFFLTVAFTPNLEKGIVVGVALSLALYIYRTMRPRISEVSMYKDGVLRDIELFGLKTSKYISVLRLDGDLYFANASYFESEILEIITEKEKLKFLILDLEWMNNIDSSGQEVLENLLDRLEKMDIKVFLTSVRVNITEKFTRIGFFKKFSEKNIFAKVDDVLDYIQKKHGKKIKTEPLQEYSPDKKKDPDLDKKILKKFDK
ncbi:SulP family inorganic anion transporter [Candidatus Gracilibacteria bacterium 28_42_T64]|nr:SulP family inorganic anion transporter [Candidatus Gracilibacteria bacterium 28_42_T64]